MHRIKKARQLQLLVAWSGFLGKVLALISFLTGRDISNKSGNQISYEPDMHRPRHDSSPIKTDPSQKGKQDSRKGSKLKVGNL